MREHYCDVDFDGFVGDFIADHLTQDGEKLAVFLDGKMHLYNGTHYEAVDDSHKRLMGPIREFVKRLRLTDRKGKPVLTPTPPSFYKNFLQALKSLSVLDDDELKAFKRQDQDIVYGKTKMYRISADTFEPYSPSIKNTYTLDFDVAETDEEPAVWQEFFEAAQMNEAQQLSWWRQRSVVVMRDNQHNRILYNFGNPRSGKGTTTAIDTAFFGRDGVAAIPRDVGSNAHSAATIVGKSLLTINDMKFDRHVNNGFIQVLLNLVGGDALPINPKYADSFDYYTTANLVISSNEVPNFRGNLSGLENKFVFNVFQRGENKPVDLTLKQRMLATMPHIIRKAVKMYRETVESGYDFDTEQGLTVREQFADSASIALRYIEECCVLGEGFNDGSLAIFKSFQTYAQEHGEHKASHSLFVTEIMTHYLGQIKNIRLTKDGKRIKVLSGLHRIGQGNTIHDSAPSTTLPSFDVPCGEPESFDEEQTDVDKELPSEDENDGYDAFCQALTDETSTYVSEGWGVPLIRKDAG